MNAVYTLMCTLYAHCMHADKILTGTVAKFLLSVTYALVASNSIQTSHIAQPQLHRHLSVLHNDCNLPLKAYAFTGPLKEMMNITFMLSACCILKMHCTYYLPCSPSLGSGPLWGCVFSASSSLFFLFCSCSINSSIVNVKTSWYFLSLSLLLIQFVTSLSVNGLILVFGATKYKYSMLAVHKQHAYNDDFQIKNILKYYMEPIWHHA